jgi:hypothetical protein
MSVVTPTKGHMSKSKIDIGISCQPNRSAGKPRTVIASIAKQSILGTNATHMVPSMDYFVAKSAPRNDGKVCRQTKGGEL